VSGQLRYAGDDLSECLHSDHRRGAGESCRVIEHRHLQSQLHQPAACLQTALLKKRSHETLARGFTVVRDHLRWQRWLWRRSARPKPVD
jgi:hypothetical protein